jgi:hypothetical protein
MTKDEIREFVEKTIRDGWDRDEIVRQITERWATDVEDAIAEAGQINTYNGQY